MKLYTEEQVRQMLAMNMAKMVIRDEIPTVDEVLAYRTPVELPTEEYVNAKTKSLLFKPDEDMFMEGAKWVIEQIKKQIK